MDRYRAFTPIDKTLGRWESDLAGTFGDSGKNAPEFKAVYRCSFDLFPYKMEGISLVPVKDGPPRENGPWNGPWYDDYPRPSGKDPVQWMIESAAKAISENKLSLDGIPKSWAKAWLGKFTVSDSGTEASALKPEAVTTDEGMTFVYIQPGAFFMGSPLDEPARSDNEMFHMVTLTKGFYLQTTEVTQGQWEAVMGKKPSTFRNCDDCPVETVSWEDTQEFIKMFNQKGAGTYRLPTEAEWEYACRAGTITPFSFGECSGTEEANYNGVFPFSGCPEGKHRDRTIPVKSFPANA